MEGAEEGTRQFLLTHNKSLNSQICRPSNTLKKDQDLIFMQIDADCDMIGNNYGK